MCRVTFGQDLSFGHLLSTTYQRFQCNGGTLVGLAVAWQFVGGHLRVEADQLLLLGAVVLNLDLSSIREYHFTILLGNYLDTAVDNHVVFKTGTHDRRFRHHQRHCLAHHVGSHQGTVCVIVLQEGDQAGSD